MTPAAGQPHLRRSSWHEAQPRKRAAGAPLVGGRSTRGAGGEDRENREAKQVSREKNNWSVEGRRNPRRRATRKILWEYLWGKKEILR
jgi:hypothetical protein